MNPTYPNSIYPCSTNASPPEASDDTPFEHLSHEHQRMALDAMDKRDVVYLLLMTADRVNELERMLVKISDYVRDVLNTADVE